MGNINLQIFGTLTGVEQAVFCLRIVLAAFCAFFIGLERSKRAKGAGIRTHVVVCLGAALFMIVSKYSFFDVMSMQKADASRIASNVVTGISFLGAGVIFVKQNSSIQGLTTAAGIWATAAIGLAIGGGLYLIGIFSTILLMVVQLLLHKILTGYDSNFMGEAVAVTNDAEKDIAGELAHFFEGYSFQLQKSRVKRLDDGRLEYRMSFKTMKEIKPDKLAQILTAEADLVSIEL